MDACWADSLLWLRCLQAYSIMFENQNVHLEALLSMGHDDLEELGIRSYGHRKSILQAFQAYLQMYLHSCDLAAQHTQMARA